MRLLYLCLLTCLIIFFVSCYKDKYKLLKGDSVLTGHLLLFDPSSPAPPAPLGGQYIYLNSASDTGTYIAKAITDTAGFFSIPSLKTGEPYIIFTRFIKNGTEYLGALQLSSVSNAVTLNVTPAYTNGMSLTFTDVAGGVITGLPFRLYTSSTMALLDSTKFAYANTVSDLNGQFNRYNVTAQKYYIVSQFVSGTNTLKVFDSVTVTAKGIVPRTPVLK